MRLLLVEGHVPLTDELVTSLTRQGYATDQLADGRDAAVQGASEPYDLITLDLSLPGRPSLEIPQKWRDLGLVTPVLILATHGSWAECIDGLRVDTGDYLTKPFHPEELTLRIQVLLRRAHGLANQSQLEAAGLRLGEQHQYVCLDDADVDLTAARFRLLHHFTLHPGQALSKGRLAERLYDGETERDSSIIKVHVNHLQRKLGREVIETHRGQGYCYAGVAAG